MIPREEIDRLKSSVPIEKILMSLGFRTEHRGYMYFSPLRDERTPSMSVRFKDGAWQWYDHGEGTGGTGLELVQRLKHCGFREAVETLASISAIPLKQQPQPFPSREVQHGIEVEQVGRNFIRFRLRDYIESRGIDIALAQQYCKEITYRNTASGRTYTAVGFPNNAGGWVLRSDSFKGTTQSCITTLNRDGRVEKPPSSERVMLFEGFFNFLSWMQMHGASLPPCDVVVLNSVTNSKSAAPFISEHKAAESFLDNDITGKACFLKLQSLCPGTAFTDHTGEYQGHNDLNELLKSSLSKGEEPPSKSNQHKL